MPPTVKPGASELDLPAESGHPSGPDHPSASDPPAPPDQPDPAKLCALNTALLRQAGARLGFAGDLTPAAIAGFERYAAEMVVWNRRFNLTRITRPDEIAIQHFLDSLICLRGVPGGIGPAPRCVDIGTGAGLPGIPVKLVRPDWRWTLVESVGKKAMFLDHVVAALGLSGVTVVRARAEDLARDPAHRGAYDLATARAVARLPVLAAYVLPLLRAGGRLLALKGEAVEDEVVAMRPALDRLGGRLIEVQPYHLPGVDRRRHLVVVEKVRRAPAKTQPAPERGSRAGC